MAEAVPEDSVSEPVVVAWAVALAEWVWGVHESIQREQSPAMAGWSFLLVKQWVLVV